MNNDQYHNYLLHASKLAKYGMYLPGILHNLNNPLTSLSGGLQILQFKYPEIEKLAELNDLMEKLNQQLGDLSMMNSQDLWPQPRECSLSLVLNQVCLFLLADGNFKHNVDKEIQTDPDYTLAITPDQFFMVLLHLFQNAIDAVLENKAYNGEIKLSYDKKGNDILFTLIDNGPGIPVDFQDKVFDPGFTTRETDNEGYKFPRMGYGLSLTSEILKQNGGAVYFIPSKENIGTRVNFAIPLKR